jgi:hypothetical protein
MTLSKTSFKIAQGESELNKIYKFQHSIFVADEELLENNNNLLKDEWDSFSYHIFCKKDNKIIGDGRLIKNSTAGFRVSSSININEYFSDNNTIFEISALCVDKSARHLGIGLSIHYLRLILASHLSGNFAIASCFKSNAMYLVSLGFEVIVDNFHYKQYKTPESSTFLAFNLSKDSSSFNKLNEYINARLCTKQVLQLKHCANELLIQSSRISLPYE